MQAEPVMFLRFFLENPKMGGLRLVLFKQHETRVPSKSQSPCQIQIHKFSPNIFLRLKMLGLGQMNLIVLSLCAFFGQKCA